MAASTLMLLRGGTILEHSEEDVVSSRQADILVEGAMIAKIATHIEVQDTSITVIDCHDKIVSPGFVDTHRHLWQSQLKGRHGNDILADYVYTGYYMGSLYSPHDILLGELCGALESIDAGTTTIVDMFHAACSEAHIEFAVQGLVTSGARVIFCPTPTRRAKSWSPKLSTEEEILPSWFMPTYSQLAAQQPFGDGRVILGMGFDGFSMPKNKIIEVISRARDLHTQLITSHHVGGSITFNAIGPLSENGILGSDILISHATQATSKDLSLLASKGAHISATPSTELQMALGEPVCFHKEISQNASLGVDCHSAASASIAGQARLALQYARGRRNQSYIDNGADPVTVGIQVQEAFNLMTIKGARAANLDEETGSVAVGKRADLVVWNTDSPSMVMAAQKNPVAAIVLHSSIRDVNSVIIDGIPRKRDEKLLPVRMPGESQATDWVHIAKLLRTSCTRLEGAIDAIDIEVRTGAEA